MNRRTQAIIGATLALLGIGVVALGYLEDESTVRYVGDVLAEPTAHASGTYTLLGVPQPPTLQVAASDGSTEVRPNPDYAPETRHTTMEERDGRLVQVTRVVTVEGPDAQGATHWSLATTVRDPSTGATDGEPPRTWSVTGTHLVFLIEGFPDGDGASPTVWGVYHGTLRDPIQPKPSQFEGRLAADVPEGALVYEVDTYTAGCSSKFLPPDVAAEYDEDGDGYTD